MTGSSEVAVATPPGAPLRTLAAAVATGAVAVAAVPDGTGVGWPVTVAAAAVAVAWGGGVHRRYPGEARTARWGRAAWAVAALALASVAAIRSAEWLVAVCLLASAGCGSLAVVGGRSAARLVPGAVAVPFAVPAGLVWGFAGVGGGLRRTGRSGRRYAVAALVGVGLVVVFGALFAGADPAFAEVVSRLVPLVDEGGVARFLVLFVAGVLLVLGAALSWWKARSEPGGEPGPGSPGRLRRFEWAFPVIALDLVFALFVVVQATVLFGGGRYVLATVEATYAGHARAGFWQLLVVTALTLVVIGVAARLADRTSAADRAWLRSVLGVLAVLALVVVASALTRMWAYTGAYGATRLRLVVATVEVWLGVVFLLVIVAGLTWRAGRPRAGWLPAAVVGTAVATLLALAGADPDRLIAERNVARWQETGKIDVEYLQNLSPDAAPALIELPPDLRTCALWKIGHQVLPPDSGGIGRWRDWNRATARAREILRPTIGTEKTLCRRPW